MSLFAELRYLFDRKLKWKTLFMILIIIVGSFAELLGVTIILPIIQLATDEAAAEANFFCKLIRRVFGEMQHSKLMIYLLAFTIVIYILKNVYLSWMAYMLNSFAKKIKMDFSVRLMRAYMKQDYAYFLHKNSAEVLRSVINDTVGMYALVANLMQTVSLGLTSILIIAYLAMTNFAMALSIAGILGIVALVIVLFVQKKMRRAGEIYQRHSSKVMQIVKQSFEGVKEVKITNKEKFFVEEFRDEFNRATKIELVFNLLAAIPKYIIETVCIGGILGYLAVAVLQGANMTLMVAQLSVFAMGAFKLLPCINNLYADFGNVLYNRVAIDNIYKNIKETESVSESIFDRGDNQVLRLENKIAIEDLCFHYEGAEKNVLESISFEILKGTSVAFVGESGSGKTTLVDNIIGILSPQKGMVRVDGCDIKEKQEAWKHNIGYIPQQIFLLDDTIKRNVAFGESDDQIDENRVWESLKSARLDEFVKTLEKGIYTEVGEAGTRLSGGQRQRIGIARALYNNPEVLVFDEATSALDTETEKEVMEAINGLHGEKTMLMIAHRLSTIENCDVVYRVGNGRVAKVDNKCE